MPVVHKYYEHRYPCGSGDAAIRLAREDVSTVNLYIN